MAALAFVATALLLLLLLLLQAPDGTLSAVAAAANVKAGFRSTCTLFPDTGVTNGQDVARAPATTAQGCLEACELNSLCCIGEFDAKATKCYLKSGGSLVAMGRRPDSSAFNCTNTVNTCNHPVGPHPPPPPTPPAPPVPVTVTVDTTAKAAQFPPYWKRSFGSGHAAITLRDDWQSHLKQAVDELGLQGVRYHGLFDDDMGPVVTAHRTYNFSKIKASWDYQRSLGLDMIVELSFMPAWLAGCSWTDPAASDPARQGHGHSSAPAVRKRLFSGHVFFFGFETRSLAKTGSGYTSEMSRPKQVLFRRDRPVQRSARAQQWPTKASLCSRKTSTIGMTS